MVEGYGIEKGLIVPMESGSAPIVVFSSPDEVERRAVIAEWGVDEHNLASALDPDELGRLDLGEKGFDMILKRPRNFAGEDQLLFTVASLGIFRSKERLLIVANDGLGLFEDRAVRKVKDDHDVILKVLYGTISHFLGHLKVINMLSESLEKRITSSMENRYLLDMFTLEKSLVYFVNGIDSNQVVLEKLRSSASKAGFSQAQLLVLDEIIIENRQCAKQAEIYSNILTGLMDARFSIVNNNLSVLMKRLTIISIIFLPMNLLAGIGGMSEFSSWTSGAPWWVAYGLFFLGLIPLGVVTFIVLNKTGMGTKQRRERPPRFRR